MYVLWRKSWIQNNTEQYMQQKTVTWYIVINEVVVTHIWLGKKKNLFYLNTYHIHASLNIKRGNKLNYLKTQTENWWHPAPYVTLYKLTDPEFLQILNALVFLINSLFQLKQFHLVHTEMLLQLLQKLKTVKNCHVKHMITDHMGHYLISCQPLHPLVIMKKKQNKNRHAPLSREKCVWTPLSELFRQIHAAWE